jgi:DNA-binding NarL/FixJ family response regulator
MGGHLREDAVVESNPFQPRTGQVLHPDARLQILVISETGLVGAGLTEALGRNEAVKMFKPCADFVDALCRIPQLRPDIVLLDGAFSDGPKLIGRILSAAPQVRVVVFGVAETADNIIAWVEAGAAGYIPRTTALSDVVQLLTGIMRDEQACSGCVAAGLMRRLRSVASARRETSVSRVLPRLTTREMQVIELICAGFSNKHIARHLNIGVATTKSHVHNLLAKLNLQRRGQVAPWMRHIGCALPGFQPPSDSAGLEV